MFCIMFKRLTDKFYGSRLFDVWPCRILNMYDNSVAILLIDRINLNEQGECCVFIL